MTDLFVTIIPGRPIPLKRARIAGKGCYDPQKREKWNYQMEVTRRPDDITKPIKVKFEYHFKMPKSWSKKKKNEMYGKLHSVKPDLSNLIKFTEDALNKILWLDDCLIGGMEAYKYHDVKDFTVIKIESLYH